MIAFENSRLIFFSNSLLLTGRWWNKEKIDIVVPDCLGTFDFDSTSSPFLLNNNLLAFGWDDFVEVRHSIDFDIEHKLDRASPRKPKVCNWLKSVKVFNFEVKCFFAIELKSFKSIPLPLSTTLIVSKPKLKRLISC